MSTGGPGHPHAFDGDSGWCAHCNLRDDGRLVGRGGEVIHEGRGYSSAELQHISERIRRSA